MVKRRAWRQAQRALFCVLAAMLITGCAAKMPARSFSELQQRLKHGATVYVIDHTNTETKGTVVDVSPSTLTLAVNGVQRRMERETVRQVQSSGDSLWNGFLIGTAVGAASAVMSDPVYEPCPDTAQMRCANRQVGQRILAVGIVGGVGAGVDALIRRRHQLYLAADQSAGVRIHRVHIAVAPRIGASTAALFVTLHP